MRDLVVRLNELSDAQAFQTSWYVKDMTTGQRADRFGGVPVPSASTRKISIMMAALAAVHAGKLSLDQKVTTTTPSDQGLLLELIWQGTTDAAVARKLGSTPELCRLGLDILSWQKLKARLPSQLPLGTKVAHKTGTGSRGFMDAGIIFKDDHPLFILTAYTEHVPAALPDGAPGFAAA